MILWRADRQRFATARALRRKEWRENMPALIAGLAIFLGLPAVCTVMYALVDPRHEVVAYVATGALIVAGWLYAAVVGAQMVCRDFGRREGHFLLSRPVSVGQVVRAKAAVGLRLVAGLLLLVGLWELLLGALQQGRHFGEPSGIFELAVGLVTACLCAFFIAFTAAAITRHALSAVMLAVLVLVLIVAGPLMTTKLAYFVDLHQRWERVDALFGSMYMYGYASSADYAEGQQLVGHIAGCAIVGAALVVVLACACVAYFLALLAVRRTRVPKFGTKSIVWTLALVMVLLFTAAMHEVGSNLPISSTCWFPAGATSSIALGKNRLAWVWHRTAGSSIFDDMALFNIAPKGEVAPKRPLFFPLQTATMAVIGPSTYVPDPHMRLPLSNVNRTLLPAPPVYAFDEQDQLRVVTTARGSQRSPTTLYAGEPVVKRCQLWRIDWDTGKIAVLGEVPFPDGVGANDDAVAYDARFEQGRMYLLFLCGPNLVAYEPNETPAPQILLGVYALRQAVPELERSRSLGPATWASPYYAPHFARGADGRLYVGGGVDPAKSDLHILGFPVVGGRLRSEWSYTGGIVLAPGISAENSYPGLVVSAFTRLPREGEPLKVARTAEIGRVVPSLWTTWLLQSNYSSNDLLSPRRGQVWEFRGNRALGYDVSDPAHPRQFAQVVSYPIQRALGNDDFLILDHGVGFSVVRLPH